MNEYRKLADEIIKRLKQESNMPDKQQEILVNLYNRADRMARMEIGCADVIIEVSYEMGILSPDEFEDYLEIRKIHENDQEKKDSKTFGEQMEQEPKFGLSIIDPNNCTKGQERRS